MLPTVWAVVRDGKIELVTFLSGDEQFWLEASQTSLEAVWGNLDDDVYADLLKG